MAEPGRSLWAALHLLDRQIVDRTGFPVAKVDDLEFTVDDDAELPVLTEILCGQAALTRRINPRLARGLEMLRRVIVPKDEPGPESISFGVVTDIGRAVTVSVDRDDLDVSRIDLWLARHVVDRIPGARVGDRKQSKE